tara:strand:- start:2004 stop:2189 length:186 start_codon:yes stop_codon:yes gene_type:complete
MHGEAILGPLEPPWKMVIRHLAGHDCQFLDSETGKDTSHDPRLFSEALEARSINVETSILV